MSKYILGSGLVGLIVKDILGEDWKLIPQGVSRYYSYPIALADDFITTTSRVGGYGNLLTPDKRIFKRAFSYGGQLIWAPLRWVADTYTEKVYNEPIGAFLSVTEMECMASKTSCHELYGTLLEKYTGELTAAHQKFGTIVSIGDGKITTTETEVEYDEAISTIPLDALGEALGVRPNLLSKDAWVYHIKTNELDFEGADQIFVVDNESVFYKVNRISPIDYLFFCLDEVKTPMEYFGAFTNNNLMVMNQTFCESFIPIGAPPDLKKLTEDTNIRCIGMHAQHDALADIGACIVRVLRI